MKEYIKNNFKRLSKGLVLFAIYIFVIYELIIYILGNEDIIASLSEAAPVYALICLGIAILENVIVARMDVVCVKVFEKRLSFMESFGLSFAVSSMNSFLPMQMGTVFKAYYFRKRISLEYNKYLSIFSGTSIIQLVITFFQLIICLLIMSFSCSVSWFSTLTTGLLFVLLVVCVIVLLKCESFVEKIVPFKKYTLDLVTNFYRLLKEREAIVRCFILRLISAIFGGIKFYCIFRMLGMHNGFGESMLCYGVYSASTIITVLPGNIGISEGILGAVNGIWGDTFEAGVSSVFLNRLFGYLVAIVGTVIFLFPIIKKTISSNGEENDIDD